MPIYEYQGKSYDIATTDPAEARKKIQAYLDVNEPGAVRSFGRSAASAADVALNAVTGSLDALARPAARAYYGGIQGMSGDELENRITAETTSPKDVIGRSLGITETPQYQGEAARRGTQALGQMIEQNVINPVAQATGQTPGYVSDIANIGALAASPAAARAGRAGGQALYATEQAATQAARTGAGAARNLGQFGVGALEGTFGGVTGRIARPGQTPGPLQTPSSRIPLGETYIDPADWARYQAGEIPIQQVQPRPIQELPRNRLDRAALAMAGNDIPVSGQAGRAFGERLGRQYGRRPVAGLLDVAATSFGLPPPVASYRGLQALSDAYLSQRLGFGADVPQQYAAARAQAAANPPAGPSAFAAGAATQPQLPYTPAGQSPISQPGPGRRVGIEGGSFNLPYEIDLSQVSTARAPQQSAAAQAAQRPQPVSPDSIDQQIRQTAAARAGVPAPAADPNSIVAQIRARAAQQAQRSVQPQPSAEADLTARAQAAMGSRYQPPAAPTGPVAPASLSTPPAPAGASTLTATPAPTADRLAQLRSQISQQTTPLDLEMRQIESQQAIQRSQSRREKMEPMYEMKRDVKKTAMAGVTKKNNRIVVDRTVFDDMAPEGVSIDWDQQPSMSALSLPQARKTIRKFIENEFRKSPGSTQPDLPENLFSTATSQSRKPDVLSMMVPDETVMTLEQARVWSQLSKRPIEPGRYRLDDGRIVELSRGELGEIKYPQGALPDFLKEEYPDGSRNYWPGREDGMVAEKSPTGGSGQYREVWYEGRSDRLAMEATHSGDGREYIVKTYKQGRPDHLQMEEIADGIAVYRQYAPGRPDRLYSTGPNGGSPRYYPEGSPGAKNK